MGKIRNINRLAFRPTISFSHTCPCGWCNCLNCNLIDNMPHEGTVSSVAAKALMDHGFCC